ncbi:hypothetical protein [Aequorivita capsosiphonis]|uniref:hypothetical protein n=1 Tax=Aequorivita capsosiphonis TaxID=487317 RepID=UPI0012F91C49|nr:hypothetical protein [Aequorivita capsosiphonis]
MSTLVSYLLAAILQFIGLSVPTEQESVSELTHQQFEETTSALPYSFIINNEQELKTNIRKNENRKHKGADAKRGFGVLHPFRS